MSYSMERARSMPKMRVSLEVSSHTDRRCVLRISRRYGKIFMSADDMF